MPGSDALPNGVSHKNHKSQSRRSWRMSDMWICWFGIHGSLARLTSLSSAQNRLALKYYSALGVLPQQRRQLRKHQKCVSQCKEILR